MKEINIPIEIKDEVTARFDNKVGKFSSNVLNEILNKVKKLNFTVEAKKYYKDSVQRKDKLVIVIKSLIKTIQNEKYGMFLRRDKIYLFNGEYWKTLDKSELVAFLKHVAIKSGLNKLDCEYHKFKDDLFKQFISSDEISFLEKTQSKVKINLQNGTFTFSKEKNYLADFSKNDFLTYQLPFIFDTSAKCPLFNQYLDRVLPEQESQNLLLEYVAYIFMKDMNLEKVLILFGDGANGKSVFFDIITNLLGRNNVSNFSISSLTDSKGHSRAEIENKLLNYSSEIGKQIDSDIFKQLASCEPVQAAIKYIQPFSIFDYARMIFNCNTLPSIIEETKGFERRFLFIHFNQTIPEEEQDKNLANKIINSELSGIFNLVIKAARRLRKNEGFTFSQDSIKLFEKFRKENDVLEIFLSENNFVKSISKHMLVKTLFSQFKIFCNEGNFDQINKIEFGKKLKKRKFQIDRSNKGLKVYIEKNSFII